MQIFQCDSKNPDDPIKDLETRFRLASLFKKPDRKEENLFKKLKSIRSSCGQVCDTTIKGTPGKVLKKRKKCQGGVEFRET
jgi:hypothetical protein